MHACVLQSVTKKYGIEVTSIESSFEPSLTATLYFHPNDPRFGQSLDARYEKCSAIQCSQALERMHTAIQLYTRAFMQLYSCACM